MSDMTYEQRQLRMLADHGPLEGEDFYRLKATGDNETRWLNITPAQLSKITEALGETPPPALPSEDAQFYTHDINDQNLGDLRDEITALDERRGRLVGIVDEEAGGIIAYAIGEDHAARVVAALNKT